MEYWQKCLSLVEMAHREGGDHLVADLVPEYPHAPRRGPAFHLQQLRGLESRLASVTGSAILFTPCVSTA